MTKVFITTSFPAFHCWPGAPDECSFLRNKHRHVFHVRMEKEVFHSDRDIEFITFKKEVDRYINEVWANSDMQNESCEMLAKTFMEIFKCVRVEVSEDGENGAIVEI